MVHLAQGFAARGFRVDLVLARARGPYLKEVPSSVRVVDLGARSVLRSLPKLRRYLRAARPAVLLTTLEDASLVALWAKRLAGVPTRVVVRQAVTPSFRNPVNWRDRVTPHLVRACYGWADGLVAVSGGVADDLARVTGLSPERITTIYNPVVTAGLHQQASAPVPHPWFTPGAPGVVLGAGRLDKQKDFETLVRAFERVRRRRAVRLMILGEGEERGRLEALTQELGLGEEVALPGFVDNPFAYMARAALFVLSSRWEGLPGVLIQAMACGCPVVSTDCPSGPREVLQGGALGPLVPVGDAVGLSRAMLDTLDDPPASRSTLRAQAQRFSAEKVIPQYLSVMGL